MREAIGGLGLTQIVIFFLVVFAGYISISVNSNKAYKVKNEVISIIQKNNGFDETALEQIEEYMTKVGYRATADCDALGTPGWDGYTSSGTKNNQKALFCIKTMNIVYDTGTTICPQFPKSVYYQVKIFFGLDIPIINSLFKFQLTGTTRKLYYPNMIDTVQGRCD